MTAVEVFAPAKINLTLHITGQREDGYHLLDSLVCFAFVGDRLRLSPAQKSSLTLTGPFAGDVPTGPENLILRAAQAMGVSADIVLEKLLPVASGIGGGSADAAAALKGLAKLSNRPLLGPDEQLVLGADVPVCVMGGLVRMRGIGERLDPISDGTVWWPMVLVNPGVAVSTPEVFKRLVRSDNPEMEDPFELGPVPHFSDDFPGWLARQRNDLEAPAINVAPVIGDVLDALGGQDGCLLSRMSGSGATCFGMFGHEDQARAAAARLGADHPGWWVALSEEPGF